MLAGSQLSSIGSLSVTQDPWRLLTAVVSALLAVGVVAYAVYGLTEIQIPGEGTLGQIRSAANDPNSRLAMLAAGDSGLRAGRANLGQLLTDYENLRTAQRQAGIDVQTAVAAAQTARTRRARREAVAAIASAKARKQNAEAAIADLRPHMVTLAQLSSYLTVRERFAAERRRILFAALAAAAFLVCFAWAANPPQPKGPAANAVPQNPSAARLLLTSAGVAELSGVLGGSCAASAGTHAGVAVIALASNGGIFDVVVVPGGQCAKPARVTVSSNMGRVVSASSVPVSNK